MNRTGLFLAYDMLTMGVSAIATVAALDDVLEARLIYCHLVRIER